jgi:hypothetical protein
MSCWCGSFIRSGTRTCGRRRLGWLRLSTGQAALLIEVDDASAGLLTPVLAPDGGVEIVSFGATRGSSPGRMSSQQASIPRTCQPPDGARLGNGPLFGDGVEEGADARLAVRLSRPLG